ncbi:PREDICTED: probable ATP-dependent RNA helicase spindle-E [Vollenhovia emeryi]|uniref:probable ATP-dependent RNA helicase spindle-E n=1 Tax=Vollenhovia emeryi TaxID=411798 RepID=UPI0005F4675D|nr:PREDICTED: probable ATP-dependent RNA helicase spindle-E [Vollenhovia emeryi]XP_011864373.1 PREDICTED: probable ATP-dependent RNA helicase spindle-E [Vollenhovia emeryi]XP_011864374.1 PREDICTED: probable ATP-dependent RNA helicase spindle-E [Vollenhovia emeryi]XP_011864375.1 PREDICTED: probable ATP-dependent RNA helicase spindle-E [Vollenhovia emeryi]
MDSSSERGNHFTPTQLIHEKSYVKDYTEAEAEEYLRYMNIRDENRKESTLDVTIHGLEDSEHKLYMVDLAKVYQECKFTYNPHSNDLSVLSMKDKILPIIETNSVVIIQGPTGCGKTTQIPQFILDTNIKKRLNCNIIVTQPRRIAAISVAKRVCHEGGWRLGSLVGYQVGMQKELSHETRLTYCTTEILLQHLIRAKHLLDYTHIILDEIHERDQHLDFLLLVVKRLLQTNSRQVKIILMSATINVTKFARYFSTKVNNHLIPAPILKIPETRHFEIRTYYLDEIKNIGNIPTVSAMEPRATQSMMNFCSLIINALDKIDMNDSKQDSESLQRHTVLVFLPGIYEIEELFNYLSSDFHKDKLWDLTILHSMVSDNEQRYVFQKPPEDYRRIILSTNIAESSITVPDVKYVIDFCLVKLLKYDPVTHYQTLQLCWASKTNCIQRAGRTGRVMDGRVYRLVPKAFYDNILEDYSMPEILRAPLANVVLRAKILNIDEPRILLSHSLDPPTLSNLAHTILSLKEVGALVDENDSYQLFDGKLTDLGMVMANLPLDIRISKLIMLGHVFGVLRDAIILGASMAVKNVFCLEHCHPTISSYTTRKKWAHDSNSDCIATLYVYKMWQNERASRRLNTYQTERQWAQRNGFDTKALHELDVLVNEITERLKRMNIKESVGINKVIWQGADRDFVLQVALAGAFYPNYFLKRLQNQEVYEETIKKTFGILDPMKTVCLRGWPVTQPGYLYAKKFQQIFSTHLRIPKTQIAISFDGSQRVYVQFREDTAIDNSLQNVSEFVYQAIKMRQCNIPIELMLLNVKEANERVKHYDHHKFERNLFFRRNVSKIQNNVPQIRPNLPGLDITFIRLFIQNIISPGYFWAILDDDTTRNKLRVIQETLNNQPLDKFSFSPKISTIVAAPMEEKNSVVYHRAIIKEHVSGVAELIDIFFIDHGRFSRMRLGDLREIDNYTILKIPPLAVSCNLAFVRPSNQSNLHQWSERSKNYFLTQIKENEMIFGNIYSVVDSVINLELIVVNEKEERLNINEGLIEKGYAVRREEGYLSKHNHELRTDINIVNAMPIEEKQFYEEEQYDKRHLLEYPNAPREEDCNLSIKLHGPCSPLEMEMTQLTFGGKSKKISVEMNSVNSVLIDTDLNQSKRLLVAQCATQNNNNHIVLRNTTLLPNIPGLATLLPLIFAPRVELRCNSRRTYYTGALCGLGPIDNYTSRAIFFDHDMEIPFDVEIAMDDIKEVNKLRHWINIGLQLDNLRDEDVIACQNKVRYILLNLMDKRRKLRNTEDDEIDHLSDKWNRYKSSHLLPSIQESAREYVVYPLHKALDLREADEQTEEMLKHLVQLQRLAYEDAQKMGNVVIFCKLCKIEMFGLLQLRSHLHSEQHARSEKFLQR